MGASIMRATFRAFHYVCYSLVALCVALAGQLAAQQSPLEEIVVTARKMDESIQEAPITVNGHDRSAA